MDKSRLKGNQLSAVENRGKSIAISAAAGSGKTTVLTARILDKLCSSDQGDLSRMLVVTFTRAAADNLVVRIRAAIENELAADPKNEHLYRQLLLVPCAKISTIHGFCLDLIRSHFQKLGLPTDVHTADEATVNGIRDDVLSDVINAYYEHDVEPEYAIADFSGLVGLFGGETSDEQLKTTLWKLYASFEKWPEGIDVLDDFIQQYKDGTDRGFMQTVWGFALRKAARDTVCHYRDVFRKAVSFIDTHENCEKYDEPFRADKNYLDTFDPGREDYAYYAGFFSGYTQIGLNSKKGNMDPEMLYYRDEREALKTEMKTMADAFSFRESDLPVAMERMISVLSDLKRFLLLFEKKFSEEKRRRHLITFADMERMALSLLWDRDHDAPSEIALAVRDGLDDVFVDEYQDTNSVQAKIFSLISREDNRFFVGDLKQSIFGFRGAKPSLFEKTLASCARLGEETENPFIKIFLSMNFRSQGHILEYANEVFRLLMNLGDSPLYGIDEELVCGTGERGNPVEITVLPRETAEDGTTIESEFVADKIQALVKAKKEDGSSFGYGDFAIILREKKNCADSFALSLKKRGIPCENSTDEFFDTPEVLLALSLFHTVDNPSHDIHLAAVLKSPLYGVTLDELLYMRRQTPEGTLYEALCAFAEKGFAKGKRFLDDHIRFRTLSSVLPCDQLIWRMYGETGLLCLSFCEEGKLNGVEIAKTNLMQLYRWSMNYSDSSTGGLHAFLTFIDQTIESEIKLKEVHTSSTADAVRILTIHEAKGLEFPVCFFCQTQTLFSSEDFRKPLLLDEKAGIAMNLLSDNGLVRWHTPFYDAVKLSIKEQQRAEELRLLYVALTRAEKQLYITASVNDTKSNPLRVRFGPTGLEKRLYEKQGFTYHSLIRSNNMLDLLLAACPVSENAAFTLLEKTETEEAEPEKESAPDILPVKTDYALERLSFCYPYKATVGIPSKLSVSNLYPDVLDEHDVSRTLDEPSTAIKIPKFLQSEPDEEITAAERGTAMHTFMQFFDFAFVDQNGVEAEIDRLIASGFLFPSDREKLNIGKLKRFFVGKTAEQMRKAKRLYREKRFLVNFPADRFTEDEEQKKQFAGQNLLVQGIMDCVLWDENDELILVDYKTDYFGKGTDPDTVRKTLCERHSRQLAYYRFACEKLYHQKVSHTWIYSFALDDCVEVPQ